MLLKLKKVKTEVNIINKINNKARKTGFNGLD